MRARVVAVWGLCCVLFVLAARAAEASPARAQVNSLTLSDIAARYDAWRGGAAFERLRSFHVAMTSLGSNGVVWSTDERATYDGWFRFDLGLPGAQLTAVSTPFTVWRACRNCQFSISDDTIRAAALIQSLDFPEALTPAASRKVELKGIEHWDGAAWAVVRLGGEQGVDVFIEPATGRMGGLRRVSDGKLVITRYADWRRVGGVRFAYSLTQQQGTDAPVTIHVKSVELDGGEDVTLYARPADVRAAVFPPGETSTGWLKLDIDPNRGPLLPIELNGKPVIALLDSGAAVSAISWDDMPAFGLKAGGSLRNRGASTEITAQRLFGGEIRIGGLTLRDPAIVAQDPQSMSAIRGARGDRPVVILGGDAFRGLIVDLDLPNSRVAFHDATGADAPLGAIELPLIQNSQLRTIPVSIENAEPAQFSVDTGYNGVIQISPAFARAHQLPGTRPASAVKVQEIGGEVLESITTLRRIAIAGVILKDTPVELPPVWMIGDRIDGMLGLTILQRFRVILDFSHDRLWLVPSRDEIYAPFWRERLGISTADGGGNIRITRIYPHSPAALAGLRPGDVIVRVNGYRASSENYIAAASGPAGAHVRLALSDGTERDIALADFY